MVSEIFDSFANHVSMGAIDPWDVASLDPRDLIGLLHTNYISCGPHGTETIFF